jgi:hypothetical protein
MQELVQPGERKLGFRFDTDRREHVTASAPGALSGALQQC